MVWRSLVEFPPDTWSHRERTWLNSSGSLTHRLRRVTNDKIELRVYSEKWGRPEHDENGLLNSNEQTQAWIREIGWYFQDELWVNARVVISKPLLTRKAQQLLQIGFGSIGDTLFSDPNLKRSEFEIAQFDEAHPYYHLICKNITIKPKQLWARRSIFYFYETPLLISEFFLPAIFNFDPGAND